MRHGVGMIDSAQVILLYRKGIIHDSGIAAFDYLLNSPLNPKMDGNVLIHHTVQADDIRLRVLLPDGG